MGPTTRVEWAAHKLLDDGEDVMPLLRAKCPTVYALSVTVSRVRKVAMERLPVPPAVGERLAPFAGEEGVAAFLALPLREMVRRQRHHAAAPRWSAEAEAALASLALLPPHVDALRLAGDELRALERLADARLLAKQEALVVVPGAVLAHAVHVATTATPGMGVAALALNLLLLSGRRSSEILNGSSTFAPTARATTCLFGGQLKTREARPPYEIPLLCEFDAFSNNLRALREAQGGRVLSASECSQRYAKPLQLALRRLYPMAPKVHALRSMYMAYVMELYEADCTFNIAAMRALGHTTLQDSLAYNAVRLVGDVEGPSFGPLP